MRTKNTAPQENKSVKTLKGQLFGAVAMMLVAAIALGTSTYAWFINNQTVEVEDMTLTVSTSTSMLVAVQKKDDTYTGYKSTVTNDDITGKNAAPDAADWEFFLDYKMTPASVTSAALATAAPSFFATNNHVSNGLLDEFDALTAGIAAENVGQGVVKKLGLRFLASNDVNVYFGQDGLTTIANLITPKLVSTDGLSDQALADAQAANAAATEQAAAIRAALRVALVAKQSGVGTDGTPAANAYASTAVQVFQFDNGDKYQPQNANNTDYNNKNTSITINENNGLYAAISAVDASKHVDAVGALNALVPGHSTDATNANKTLAQVAADGTVTAPAPADNPIALFDLDANVARDVDVYIWLEGTDQDCLNQISGYLFNLGLPFAAALATA